MSLVYCPECKSENSSLAEYCKKCGADFKKVKPSTVPYTSNETADSKPGIIKIGIGTLSIVFVIVLLIGSGFYMNNAGYFKPATPTITRTPLPTSTPRPGNMITTWPSGYGYLTNPTHKPSKAYTVYTFSTDWEIWGESFENLEAHGEIEYFNSQNMAFAPGAKITNRNRENLALEVADYNGDKCRIPYGMTVEVDQYGQFQPYWYYPEMSLPK